VQLLPVVGPVGHEDKGVARYSPATTYNRLHGIPRSASETARCRWFSYTLDVQDALFKNAASPEWLFVIAYKDVNMNINELDRVNIQQLPHSLQALIDCIGMENTYRLTSLYGGRAKYIPKHAQRTSLAKLLPPDALAALIKRFAGLALEIPKVDHFWRQLRNLQIRQESSAGCSRSMLASKYGLSQRQIGNIRRTDSACPA